MAEVVVVGAAAIDLKATAGAPLVSATSNPGLVTASPGGVGRNIAETLARLGSSVRLVSRVADDSFGRVVLAETAAAGVDVSAVHTDADRTATYVATLDSDGSLSVAVSDFASIDSMTLEHVNDLDLGGVAYLVLDANLPGPVLSAALRRGAEAGTMVVVEPVSVAKAGRLADLATAYPAHLITPNEDEYAAIASRVDPLTLASTICLRRGLAGSRLLFGPGADPVDVPAVGVPPEEVRDVTGAGDSATAGLVHALARGARLEQAVAFGHAVAARTVRSERTVPTDLDDLPEPRTPDPRTLDPGPPDQTPTAGENR